MILSMNCSHFGVCGGCVCEKGSDGPPKPPPYQKELAEKEGRVRTLLAPYEVAEWHPIIPTPDEWHYRNKMECACGVWDEQLVLGLRAAGRFDQIIDLQTCFLMSPECLEVLRLVRQWANDQNLQGYHRRRHEGDLRYLVLREGKNTGQRMAILVATSGQVPTSGESAALTLPKELNSLLTTCWLGVTDDL